MTDRYPLEIRNVGDDTCIVMSKGHHDPHLFMRAVREEGFDWPLGMPEHRWVKAVPCPPSCGLHTCHYATSDTPRKGWFPATYAWETYGENAYKPTRAPGVATDGALSPHAAALDVETVLERLDFIAGHEASAILRDTAEAAAAMIRAAHGVSVIDTADHVLHGPTGETWVVARVNGKHLHPCGWPPTRADLSDCTLVKKATLAEREQLLRDLSQGQTEHAGWAAGALGVATDQPGRENKHG